MTSNELTEARLRDSLAALRRDLARLDAEILATLAPFLDRRQHFVSVVWTIKDALGDAPVNAAAEEAIDEKRLEAGIPPERVAILRAVREATRPR